MLFLVVLWWRMLRLAVWGFLAVAASQSVAFVYLGQWRLTMSCSRPGGRSGRVELGPAPLGGGVNDDDRRAVAEHFGDALPNLGGVIGRADDGVGATAGHAAPSARRPPTGELAHLAPERDVSAEERLHPGEKTSDNAARAHDNAPDDAEVLTMRWPGSSKAVVTMAVGRWTVDGSRTRGPSRVLRGRRWVREQQD